MRLLEVTTMMLIATPALGADFRVLNFGESCAQVAELESVLGSEKIAWNPSGPEHIAFRVEEFGGEVDALYFCPKGALYAGNYFFPLESSDEALMRFASVYDALKSRYGDAFVNNTPWQKDADPRAVAPDPHDYMVSWKDSRVWVTLSIMDGHDKVDSTWQVFLVLARPNAKHE